MTGRDEAVGHGVFPEILRYSPACSFAAVHLVSGGEGLGGFAVV